MTRFYRSLSLALAAFTGIHTYANTADANLIQNSPLNAVQFYQILTGEISAQNGDLASAYGLMLDAARKSNDPKVFERAVELALAGRNGDAALQASKAWLAAHPDSKEANRYLLQILIGLNKLPEALAPLQRELTKLSPPERIDAIRMWPRYFTRTADKAAAATLIERALATELNNKQTGPSAWAAIGRVRQLAGNTAGTLEAIQRGAQLNPLDDAPVFLALSQPGVLPDTSDAIVRNYLASKSSADVRITYARKLLDAQRDADAYVQLQTLTSQHPTNAEAWLIRGSLELQEKKWELAQTSLDTYLKLTPSDSEPEMSRATAQAYFLLAQIAEHQNNTDQALSLLDKISSPSDIVRAQTRRALILARQGKLEPALTLLKEIKPSQPEDARTVRSTEVQILIAAKQYAQAHQMLVAAINKDPEDWDFTYDLAMLAEKMGSLDEMETLLRRIIAKKPDYHAAYNALGYSFADRNIRLDEARQLLTKALAFAPNDPFIIDSMGWLEFRSGNLATAQRLLEDAYKARPDAEIAAHLGEVLWTNKQPAQAQTIWNEGLQLNPDNETLRTTIRRLTGAP